MCANGDLKGNVDGQPALFEDLLSCAATDANGVAQASVGCRDSIPAGGVNAGFGVHALGKVAGDNQKAKGKRQKAKGKRQKGQETGWGAGGLGGGWRGWGELRGATDLDCSVWTGPELVWSEDGVGKWDVGDGHVAECDEDCVTMQVEEVGCVG